MKKIILALAVLVLAAPALATTVTISCQHEGCGTYSVSYATDGNLPRAFALEISVTAGTVLSIGNLNEDYRVYPGTIVIIDGEVNDAGTPIAEGGIGESSMVIEMGSLYEEGVEPAPDTNGVLFTFTVSTGCDVVITENAPRGGVVMEDHREEPTVDISSCPAWWWYPECWDGPGELEPCKTQCHGDADCSGDVKASDFLPFKKSWYKCYPDPDYDPCADFDRNGEVKAADFMILRNNWYQTVPGDCPPGDLYGIYNPCLWGSGYMN